jgi:hypothetical protein
MYICGMKKGKYTSRLDNAGMTASILCAIHCAIVPLLITMLPLAGLGFLANPLIEWSMIIFALCVGTYAIGLSYFRTHHKPLPAILLITGFLVIIAGHVFVHDWHEAIVVPIGGFLIATSHFFNYRYSAKCHSRLSFFPVKHDHPHKVPDEVLAK